MANNRIYLKCNVCGGMLYLGKSYMGYYWENYGKLNGDPDSPPLEDRLNEFFKKHTFCNNEGNDGDYSIEYESPFRDTVEVVRCDKCKHYPIGKDRDGWVEWPEDEYGFTDDTCPYFCEDGYYSKMPPEDGFCDKGEEKDDADD